MFDPEAVRRPLPLANRAKFNFMTNGKWEQRKGWDVLLRAYYAEFAAKGANDVALHFVARMNDEAREQFRAFQHNISREVRNQPPPCPPDTSPVSACTYGWCAYTSAHVPVVS